MNITPFDTFTPPGSGTVTRDYPQVVFAAPYFSQNRLADMLGSIVTDAVNAMLPGLLSDSPYIQAAVDAAITALAVLRSGDTMTGPLFFTDALPTQDHQAATKLYVDLMLAGAGGGGLEEVPAYPSDEIWARSLGAWVPISDLLAGGTTPGGDGTVTSITAGLGLTGGTITTTGTIALANTTVSPGSYTNANITVDAQGRLISASSGAAPGPGDGSAGGTVTQINTGIGLTGGPITATGTISLANTAVTPGTYQGLTIDAQGRITAATNTGYVTSSGVTSITAGMGLTGGTITTTGSFGLSNTGVAAGSYSLASLTVDAQGRITAVTSGTAGGTGTVQSIATGTGLTGGPISVAGTIALANTAVTPGSYTLASLTVDQQGRLTAASSGTIPDYTQGVTDGSDAAVGQVGEYRQIINQTGVAMAIQNTTNAMTAIWTNIAQLSLPAGDWDVTANVAWDQPTLNPPTDLSIENQALLSSVGTGLPDSTQWPQAWIFTPTVFYNASWGANPCIAVGTRRFSSAAPFTVFLRSAVIGGWGAAATVGGFGAIIARRMR